MIAPLLILLAFQAPAVDPRWQLAFERADDLWVSRADGSQLVRIARKSHNPRWSRDGKKLAYYRDGKVYAFDFATRKESVAGVATYRPSDYGDCYLDWDPKTRIILCSAINGDGIQLIGGGGSILKPRNAAWFTYGQRWSPSGKTLAFIRNGDVWIANRDLAQVSSDARNYYDAANRLAPLATFNDIELGASAQTPFWVDDLEWTRDEKRLVFHFQRHGGSGVSEIGYLDLRPGEPDVHNTSGFSYTVHWILEQVLSPRICPDGKTLSCVTIGQTMDLTVCSWDGHAKRTVLKSVENPDWRPQ